MFLDVEQPVTKSAQASASAVNALYGALLMAARTPCRQERYKRAGECAEETMVRA